jgi:hypothetical protein
MEKGLFPENLDLKISGDQRMKTYVNTVAYS